MIFKITQENIADIHNQGLKKDAEKYVYQYENFNNYIKENHVDVWKEEILDAKTEFDSLV